MVDGSNSVYNYSGSAFSSVNVKYSFSVTASGTYVLGLGLYRGEELLQSQSLGSQNVTSGNTWTFSSFGLWGLGRSLQNGVYQIKCIFKENGSSQWDKNEDGDYKYIEVTIAGDTATFVEKEEYPQVEVTSVEQRDGGLRKRIRAYIKNTSEMNFDGSMLLLINDALYSKENVYVNAGDESFIDFLFNYSNTDPVHLKIACRTSSNVVYDNENFSIVSVLPQQNPEVLAYEMRNIDIVKLICKELGKPESLITYVTDRKGHDMRYAIDPTKIHNELGWLPETKFADGIKKTIKWYLENKEWWEEIISGEYRNYYEKMYANR